MALTEKQLRDQELIKWHSGFISSYLAKNTKFNFKIRRKIMDLYNQEINRTNIRYFINREAQLFIKALILGRLEEIKNYSPSTNNNNQHDDED